MGINDGIAQGEITDVKTVDAGGVETGTASNPVRIDPTGTTPQPSSQSGAWNINDVTGTVSLPTGASTSANQATGNASLASIDTKVSTAANQTTLNTRVGDLTETAPASDTASSGLNGRLQRIAQRITSLIGIAATEATSLARNVLIGAVDETAPGTDTASSGLNGRLQRIAQRLTSIFTAQSDGTQQSKIRGNTDGTLIGNVSDRLKTVISQNRLETFDSTYSASASGFTFDAGPTDIFTIRGSATREVRILRMTFSATKTSAANLSVTWVKRSTDNSGGTSVALTSVPHDSTSAAATAEARYYTANPTTLGTLVGEVYSNRYYFSSGTGLGFGEVSIDFLSDLGGPIILRGVNEILSINMKGTGVTVAGNLTEATVRWTEV